MPERCKARNALHDPISVASSADLQFLDHDIKLPLLHFFFLNPLENLLESHRFNSDLARAAEKNQIESIIHRFAWIVLQSICISDHIHIWPTEPQGHVYKLICLRIAATRRIN